MNYEEMYLKLLTGEIEYVGGLSSPDMKRPLKWAIREYKILREILDVEYIKEIANDYFKLINAILIYKERIGT